MRIIPIVKITTTDVLLRVLTLYYYDEVQNYRLSMFV